ncbi:MAG: hypothetical protein QOG33_847 [Gaiellales bacterium]|jgi:hypothetical protein|nr:hypothetical protein [Gaiellales bacterium]
MMEFFDSFEDLPILAELEAQIHQAARRGAHRAGGHPRRRRVLRVVLIVLALLTLAASVAAGAALLLRASIIPSPAARDVQPQMRPLADTPHLLALRAADPVRGLPWGMRVARSQTGLTCVTVGQVRGGQLGVVGFDGRYRDLPDGVLDGCGAGRATSPAAVGARVFDARRYADVRTVIFASAGDQLKTARLETVGGAGRMHIGAHGTVLRVLRGYPEDSRPRLLLRFAGGSRTIDLGSDPAVLPDPVGGPAWRVQEQLVGGRRCVTLGLARAALGAWTSPSACGRRSSRSVLAVRTLHTTSSAGVRTRIALWGHVNPLLVRSVKVTAGTRRASVLLTGGGSLLSVLPASAAMKSLKVHLVLNTGRQLSLAYRANRLREVHP